MVELCTDHCVVTYMDLIGVKKLITDNSRNAVQIMQNFHQVVYDQINEQMDKHQHAYSWNDSVIIVANIDKNCIDLTPIMKQADNLKKKIDNICKCYAISVKGMTFSEPLFYSGHQFEGQIHQPKFVFLKASSYAFSNCFAIERELGENNKSWYLDERIISNLAINKDYVKAKISMLPNSAEREVYMYDGYLW